MIVPDAIPASSWFEGGAPLPDRAVRVLCFPHAGASAYMFREWHALVPASIGVAPVQLPGRGERLRERPFRSLSMLVQRLAEALPPLMDRPFALFGHSIGALIAFELARRLEHDYGRGPAHLFVSGRGAPDLPASRPPIHHLPQEEFVAALRDYSHDLRGLLGDPEAMELFVPILRADLTLSETYVYHSRSPLSCPITVLGGERDATVPVGHLTGWRRQTDAEFVVRLFPGDHFFVTTAQRDVVRTVAEALLTAPSKAAHAPRRASAVKELP